jgi:hypothetical protein
MLKYFFLETHWNDVGNRRRFFLEFARKLGFDPLVAKNWYSQYPKVKHSKVIQLLYFHFLFKLLFLQNLLLCSVEGQSLRSMAEVTPER